MRQLLGDAGIIAVRLRDARGHTHRVNGGKLHVRAGRGDRPETTRETGKGSGEGGIAAVPLGDVARDVIHAIQWHIANVFQRLDVARAVLPVEAQRLGIAAGRPADRAVDTVRLFAGLEQLLHIRRERLKGLRGDARAERAKDWSVVGTCHDRVLPLAGPPDGRPCPQYRASGKATQEFSM